LATFRKKLVQGVKEFWQSSEKLLGEYWQLLKMTCTSQGLADTVLTDYVSQGDEYTAEQLPEGTL
jgi:hypothetical protein